jgi:hypothetical protein
MENKSPWPLALKFGLILALSNIAITMVFYLINPNSADGKWSLSGVIQLLLSVVLAIYILFAAGKMRRDQDFGGIISYGQSLGFMLITAIPAALIISFFTYLFFTYINPELVQKIWDAQAEELAKSGKSDEEIEMQLSMVRKFSSPMMMTIFGGLGTMFQMLIYALIASIFVKKDPITQE